MNIYVVHVHRERHVFYLQPSALTADTGVILLNERVRGRGYKSVIVKSSMSRVVMKSLGVCQLLLVEQ